MRATELVGDDGLEDDVDGVGVESTSKFLAGEALASFPLLVRVVPCSFIGKLGTACYYHYPQT